MTLDELRKAQYLLEERKNLVQGKSRLLEDRFLEIRYNPKTGETRLDLPSFLWGAPPAIEHLVDHDIKPMCAEVVRKLEQLVQKEIDVLKAQIEALGVDFLAEGQSDENQD